MELMLCRHSSCSDMQQKIPVTSVREFIAFFCAIMADINTLTGTSSIPNIVLLLVIFESCICHFILSPLDLF